MADKILPSKLVTERIAVTFSFIDELAWGETIVSAYTDIEALVGYDTEPWLLLFRASSILGTDVTQKLQLGVPGVIYQLKCSATGSTGNVYEKLAKVAILPTQGIAPPPVGSLLTSRPYPVDVIDGLLSTSPPFSGRLSESITESLTPSLIAIGGTLVVLMRSYVDWPPEGLIPGLSVISGTLAAPIRSYVDWPPEGLNVSLGVQGGSVVVILIQYANWPPEGLLPTLDVLSGSLI